jgi:VWFA-related protein
MAPSTIPPTEKLSGKETLAPTALSAPRMNRKFFFLIDVESNDLAGIEKARSAMLHFLDTQLLPTDEVGVFSYSFMKGVVLHIYLTTDHQKVREAIQRIKEVPGIRSGGTGGADTGFTIMAGSGGGSDTKIVVGGSFGLSKEFTARMINLAKALRYIPGYKNILYFSQGLAIRGTDGESLRRLEDMSQEFAASNAPFYAVNTKTPDPFIPNERESHPRNEGKDMLTFVAERTGGKAYEDAGAVDHFNNVASDIQNLTRNYYVLGYPVSEKWDGKYHKIKVEIPSGDYRVQAQAGYFNPKPFREFSDLEKELHLFDLAFSEKPMSQMPMIFSMLALNFISKEDARVLMLSKIPPEVIEKFSKKKVELVTLIFDEHDNLVDRKQTKPDLTKYRGMDVFYASDAPFKPGAYRCRIIIRDLDTGDSALAYTQTSVLTKASNGLSIYTPLLLASGSNFVYLDGTAKKNAPPWMEIYSYDRAQYSPIIREAPKGTTKLFAVVPCSIPRGVLPNITLTAFLISSTSGEKIPMTLSVLTKASKADLEIHFIELPLKHIPPGKYLLYIHAEDGGTRFVSYVQTPLIIK